MDLVPLIQELEIKHHYDYDELANDVSDPRLLEIRKRFNKERNVSRETMIDLISKNYSMTDISKIVGVGSDRMRKLFVKYNLQIPSFYHYKAVRYGKEYYTKSMSALSRFTDTPRSKTTKFLGKKLNGYYIDKVHVNINNISDNAIEID